MKRKAVNRLGPGLSAVILALAFLPAQADPDKINEYQFRRLMQPTPGELAGEEKGRVFIYERMQDKQVDTALDENFDRMDSMMFINTQRSYGEPDDYDDDCD